MFRLCIHFMHGMQSLSPSESCLITVFRKQQIFEEWRESILAHIFHITISSLTHLPTLPNII